LHLKRLFDNAGLPTTKPIDSALRAVTKEGVGLHILVKRAFFGDTGVAPNEFRTAF
jgi:hypothetical protein